MPQQTSTLDRYASTRELLAAGIAGPVLFVALFTVSGWLRPGYSAIESPVSDLGVGEKAWIQNANFLLFAVLLFAYAVGFQRVMFHHIGARARTGGVIIACAGVGLVGAVVFPATPATGLLHFLLGFLIVIASGITAAFYGGRQFRHLPGGQRLARYSTWTAMLALALFFVTFMALSPASPLEQAGIGGLVNRTLAVELFAWYAVTGWWLQRHTPTSQG